MMERKVRCSEQDRERARLRRRHPTPEEAVLWQALRTRQIRGVKFRRQNVFCGRIVDFWCPALLVVVDVDGEKEEDVGRDASLAAKGIVTIRVTGQQVRDDLPGVIKKITFVVDARRTALSRIRPVVAVNAATGEQSVSYKPALRAMSPKEGRRLYVEERHGTNPLDVAVL